MTDQLDLEKMKIEAHEAAQQALIEVAAILDTVPDRVDELTSSSLKKLLTASTAYPIVGIDKTKFSRRELALLDDLIKIKELHMTVLLGAMFVDKPKEVTNEDK